MRADTFYSLCEKLLAPMRQTFIIAQPSCFLSAKNHPYLP
jgi:hypothetical protein